MKLTVNLGKDSYPIYIENNILSQAGNYIRKMYHGKRIMIISDDNVFPLYGDTLIRTLDSDYESGTPSRRSHQGFPDTSDSLQSHAGSKDFQK